MRPVTQERLDELSTVPPLRWRELFKVDGDMSEADAAAMDSYFSKFVMPEAGRSDETTKCIGCGAILTGGIIGVLLGATFTYGLVHGEGFCSKCGWPARANHYDVGPIKRLVCVLQYHPSGLKLKTPAVEEAQP